MSRRAGSRNTRGIPSGVVQPQFSNKEEFGVHVSKIASEASAEILERLKKIEKISTLTEPDMVDECVVLLLRSFSAIRSIIDENIRILIESSLTNSDNSERSLAAAAGISNHTVSQWKKQLSITEVSN